MSTRTSVPPLPNLLTGRRGAWGALLLAVLVSIGLIGALRGAEVLDDHGSAPPGSESAQVADLLGQLPGHHVQHLVVVVTRHDGTAVTDPDLGRLADLGAALPAAAGHEVTGPVRAEDRGAALLQVPVSVPTTDTGPLREVVDELRGAVVAGLPEGLSAQTTGGPALGADLAASFDGANLRLLLVTVAVVGLLLLLTYRSPILWVVPIAVVGLADQTAGVLTRAVGERLELTFDSGIISVLVFGAGANYALLLISRYREELHRYADHREALVVAWRATLPAILASNVSVVLALATLTLAVVPGTRGIGIAAAVGLLVALAFAVLVLPAALAVAGRGAFWPFVPRPGRQGDGAAGDRVRDPWGAVAGLVVRRPWQVLAGGTALFAVMAAGLAGTEVGLSQTERFRVASESAAALETLAEHFPAGSGAPMTVVTPPENVQAVAAAVTAVPGVASVRPADTGSTSAGEIATLVVTGDAIPGSDAERDLVTGVREAARGVPAPPALVGGAPAVELDTRAAAMQDLLLVAPLVLAVVAVVLAILLRSVVAPLVLLAVNVLSTMATIGAGAWLGRRVFGWEALDTPVPLLAFLFLVALGIDFTIFLVHRIRTETPDVGTRDAVVRGVSTTGAVITSAGAVLAGVFGALGVLPLITLGQLGLIVGLGVVLDTMLVRTLVVPALIVLLGDRFWWPGQPRRHLVVDAHESTERLTVTGSGGHRPLRTVDDMLRYLFRSAVSWAVVGLLGGLAYREVTKAFDFTGRTQLAVVHTHALTLGTLLMLLLLALTAAFPGLRTDRRLRWGTHLLNTGLVLTVGLLAYKGTLQVIGAPHADHPAVAGVSGLGHLLLTAALGLALLATGRAVDAHAVDVSTSDTSAVRSPAHHVVRP